jgi:hypothetical protein
MKRFGLPIGPAVVALVLVLLLLAAAGFLAACGSATLNAYEVKLTAAGVQSTAAEAALLAGGAARGHSTQPFVRAHAGELAQSASSTTQQLASARAGPALAASVRELARISAVTQHLLERLAGSPGDRALAASVAVRCSALAERAKRIAS